MPRPPRILLSQSYYHIITRGNNKNTIFRFDADYFYFLNLITKYKNKLPFNLYHYCLMPNHVHMLIQTHNAADFSLFMKKLNLSYCCYYKKQYGWIGHFWQDRFKSQPVGKDEYFLQCGKYIELNPVRANIVDKPENYHFSSYKYYRLGEENDLITEDFLYQEMGENEEDRRKQYQKITVGDIVLNAYTKKAWGSKEQRYNEARKLKYHKKLKRTKFIKHEAN